MPQNPEKKWESSLEALKWSGIAGSLRFFAANK